MTRPSEIARRQLFPAPLPSRLLSQGEDAVLFRYDGKRLGETDIFFVMIPVLDLAKIPEEEFVLGAEDINGEDAFFRETSSGICLYLESEMHADKLSNLRALDTAGKIRIFDAVGDLRAMGGPDAMAAPEISAYEQNGFREVGTEIGLQILRDLRRERLDGDGPDHDDSTLSP